MNTELTYNDLLNVAKQYVKDQVASGDLASSSDFNEAAYDIAVDVTPCYVTELVAVLASDTWIPVAESFDSSTGFVRLIQQSIADQLREDIEQYIEEYIDEMEEEDEEETEE